MISYDELCQALDRYNSRLKNETEMNQLEQDSPADAGYAPGAAATFQATGVNDSPISYTQTAAGGFGLPGMDQESIDQALGLREAAAAAEQQAFGQEQPEGDPQQVSSEDQIASGELTQERPEDTHEIDVDDVVVDDK